MNNYNEIIDTALFYGSDFAEVFVENSRKLNLFLSYDRENHRIIRQSGLGIRVRIKGEYYYAYTSSGTNEELLELTRDLCLNKIHDRKSFSQKTIMKVEHKPTLFNDKRELLKEYIDSSKGYNDFIKDVSCSHYDESRHIHIQNSEGLNRNQSFEKTRLLLRARAEVDGVVKGSYIGPGGGKGIEIYDQLDLKRLGERVMDSAISSARAEHIKAGKMPVIIESGFGGLFFHEACGHSLEAKSFVNSESEFCGKLNEKIASDKVTLIDNGSIDGAWGSQRFDDEGNDTGENILIENGILKTYLVDRASGEKLGMKANGSSRRESYKFAPTSRMSNTYLKSGSDKKKDMISNTEYGLYVKSIDGGSVNPTTGEFNFSVLEGYQIIGGEIKNPIRGATLIGKGGDVLKAVDAVGDDSSRGQGFCYDRSGTLFIEAGQPSIRVKEITVGGLK